MEPSRDVLDFVVRELIIAVGGLARDLYEDEDCMACAAFLVSSQMMPRQFHFRKCQKSCERDDLAGGGTDASIATQIFACALLDQFLEDSDSFSVFLDTVIAKYVSRGGHMSLYTRRFMRNGTDLLRKIHMELNCEIIHGVIDVLVYFAAEK